MSLFNHASAQPPNSGAHLDTTPQDTESQGACPQYSWPVAEHFCSINGEGPHAGRLAAFIRFPKCNLSCTYCDTAWANEPHCETEQMSLSDLIAFVSSTGACRITITGGEPLLQPHFEALIFGLLAANPDWKIEIETNGATSLDKATAARNFWAHERVELLMGKNDDGQLLTRLNRKNIYDRQTARVIFTMDWKLPSSGMEEFMLPANLERLDAHDSIKFVCGSQEDLDRALEIMEEHDLRGRRNVFFSPVFGQMDPADLVAFLQKHRLAYARVQLQLQKVIWPNAERGV